MINRVKGFLGLSGRVLGIALESDAAHLVEVARERGGRVVKNILLINSFSEQSTTSIQQLLSSYGVRANEAVVALDCRQVFFRGVAFPYMTEKELLSTIQWEVQRHVPYEMDTYDYDCVVLSSDATANKSVAMIVAVKKETVSLLVEKFAALGIKLAAVESDVFSLARLAEPKGDYLIASMRQRECVIMAYQAGVPFLARGFSVDNDQEKGRALSQAVLRSLEQCRLQRQITVPKVYLCGSVGDMDLACLSAEWRVEVQLLCPTDFLRYDASLIKADLSRRALVAAAAVGTMLRGDVH